MSKTLPARLRSPPPRPNDAPELKRSRSTSCRGPFGHGASSDQLNVWDLEQWTQPEVQPELCPQKSAEEEEAETLKLLDRLVSMEGVIDDLHLGTTDLVGGLLKHSDESTPHLLPPPATAAEPAPQLVPSALTPSLQPQFASLQLAQPLALPACATPMHSSPGWALSMANEQTPAKTFAPLTAMVQAPGDKIDPWQASASAPACQLGSAMVNVQPQPETVAGAMANVLGLPEKLGGSGQNKAERLCWTSEEDAMIVAFVREYGQKWRLIASMLQGRSDDAVRNRWNRVRDLPEHNNGSNAVAECGPTPLQKPPALKGLKLPHASGSEPTGKAPADDDSKPERSERVSWSRWEDDLILRSVAELGHKWHKISTRLPGRTGHAIRNRNSRLQSLASRGHALSFTSNPGVPIGIQLIPQQRESPQRISF